MTATEATSHATVAVAKTTVRYLNHGMYIPRRGRVNTEVAVTRSEWEVSRSGPRKAANSSMKDDVDEESI